MMKLLIEDFCYFRQKSLSKKIKGADNKEEIDLQNLDNKSIISQVTKEKHVKVSDFVNGLLATCTDDKLRNFDNIKLRGLCFELLCTLQDQHNNYDDTILALRVNNFIEIIWMIIDSHEFSEENRINWLIATFKFALRIEKMEVAVNLWETYSETFDTESHDLINAILRCFDTSSFHFELKYYILNNFLENFEYKQVD